MSEITFEQGRARIGKARRPTAILVISGLALILCLACTAGTAQAQGGGEGQTYFVPLPEAQTHASLDAIYDPGVNSPGFDIMSIISIVPIVDSSLVPGGTTVYYDHWEDGYEADIQNPIQPTTEIWGPLDAGDVVALANEVFVNPRDPNDIRYDGGDKFFATQRIAVSRAQWATDPGTVLAGAVEILDTTNYGMHFKVPIGEDLFAADPTSDVAHMFEYVSLFIMAQHDSTVVEVDIDGDGTPDDSQVLDQGESFHVNGGVQTGTSITSSRPVQADLFTGDVAGHSELRWYALWPTNLWDDSYYSAVGGQAGNDTDVWIYNYNGATITVTAETRLDTDTFTVQAGDVYRYSMPEDSGAHFYTPDGSVFYALATVDSGSQVWDWGFTLLPESSLSTMAVVGWGPGHDTSVPGTWDNRSPLWVTAVSTTTVYVDYDGNPSTGAEVDPQGNRCDVVRDIGRFESVRFYDDADGDQTGTRAYTTDGTLITAAWGEEMGNGHTGNPYLDLGTTVMPVSTVRIRKYAALTDDINGNGLVDPGDAMVYTITVENIGTGIASNVVVSATVSDSLSANASYVLGSAYLDDGTGPSPIPDDPPPSTVFPLDEGGYWIDGLLVGSPTSVMFDVTVNDPFEIDASGCSVANGVRVNSNAGDGGAWVMMPVAVSLDLDIAKTVTPSPPMAWEPFTYTLNLTNNGPMSATLVLTDILPSDHFYVAGSGAPSGPDVATTSALVWQDLGPVDPGESVVVTYQVTVTPGISGTFLNASEVYAMCPCGVTVARAEIPTAVELLYFRAGAVGERGVRLEWATSVELDSFGFNLYRAAVRDRSAADVIGFVPSRARGGGATYVYEDILPADGSWWYWLSDVDTSGQETFHGPVKVGVGMNVWQRQIFLPIVLRQG